MRDTLPASAQPALATTTTVNMLQAPSKCKCGYSAAFTNHCVCHTTTSLGPTYLIATCISDTSSLELGNTCSLMHKPQFTNEMPLVLCSQLLCTAFIVVAAVA